VSQALTENAPVTLLNYPGGHHAFEIVDNAEATRAVIDRTIAFVKEATRPDYQESLRRAAPVAFAASLVMARKYADAARPRDLGIPAAYACMQKGDPGRRDRLAREHSQTLSADRAPAGSDLRADQNTPGVRRLVLTIADLGPS
jgi:hypothetical protein